MESYPGKCNSLNFKAMQKPVLHSLDSNRASDENLNAKNLCLSEIEFHANHAH